MVIDFKEKVAVVTGGAGGIGAACVKELLDSMQSCSCRYVGRGIREIAGEIRFTGEYEMLSAGHNKSR